MKNKMVLTMLVLTVWAGMTALAQQQDADAAAEEIVIHLAGDASPSMIDLLQKGGPLMYPLYLCSILVVAFVIERAVRLRRSAILPPDVVTRVRGLSKADTRIDPQTLLNDLRDHPSPLARVITAGLRRADRPLPELEKAIEDAGQREADALRRGGKALSIVASVAPLLGLLGTVLGMIKSFMTVAASEEALGRTELLAGGIYQALVTTATGLSIAIPSLVFYYLFADKGDRLVSEMDAISIDLVENLRDGGRIA